METTLKISKELEAKIIKYLKDNPNRIFWGYRDELSNEHIRMILEERNGLFDVENQIYHYNLDYIFDLENEQIKNVIKEFEYELTKELGSIDDIEVELREYFLDYLYVDINLDELIRRIDDLTCLIYMYSNYDCTNSFDTMETSDYLQQVYARVRAGVKKADFMYEHENGAYGGSVFCFAFRGSIEEVIELKQQMEKGKKIFIPKGTQFGFFSSFQGAGSVFEKTTYRNFHVNIKETGGDFHPDFDHAYIQPDISQSYNMVDVYGSNDFIYEQDIKIV